MIKRYPLINVLLQDIEDFKTNETHQKMTYYLNKIQQQKSEYVLKQEESKALAVRYLFYNNNRQKYISSMSKLNTIKVK